jgi:hypothetical protein
MAEEGPALAGEPYALWQLLGLIRHLLNDALIKQRLDHGLIVKSLVRYSDEELPLVKQTLLQVGLGAEFVQTLIRDLVDGPLPDINLDKDWDEGQVSLSSTNWSVWQILSLIPLFISSEELGQDNRYELLSSRITRYESIPHLRMIHYAASLVIRLLDTIDGYLYEMEGVIEKSGYIRLRRRIASRRGNRPGRLQ